MTGRQHLSIGEVLSLLREEFSDITISKIRFLETQGLLDPERTPSGYRKFYEDDVEQLRWILRQQREHFLPLKVIKGRLSERDGELGEVDEQDEPSQGTLLAELGQVVDRGDPPPERRQIHTDVDADSGEARPDVAAARGAQAGVVKTEPFEADLVPAGALPGGAVPGGALPGGAGSAKRTPAGKAQGRESSAPAEGPPALLRSVGRTVEGGQVVEPAGSAAGGRPTSAFRGERGGASEGAAVPERSRMPEGVGGSERVSAGERAAASEPVGASGPVGAAEEASGPGETGVPVEAGVSEPWDPPESSGAPEEGGGLRAAGTRSVAAAIPARASDPPGEAGSARSTRGGSRDGELTVGELAVEVGMTVEAVKELERYGLFTGRLVGGTAYYDHDALSVASAASVFAQHGIEARHLRSFKTSADREAGLLEQVIMPLLKQRNPQSRQQAHSTVEQLSAVGGQMRAVLLRRALRDVL